MISDLLSGLDTSERECVVITSASVHTEGDDLEQRNFENVRTIRIPGLARGNGSLLQRLFNFFLFYLGVIIVGLRTIKRDDAVICLTDPPLVSVFVQPIARLKRARMINWLQDIYPETATVLGFGSDTSLVVRMSRFLRDRSWKLANVNVCIGSRMAQRVAAIGVDEAKIRVIPNWADEDELAPLPIANNPLRSEWNLSESSVIVGYSGNLGRAHDVDTMLDAGRRLIAMGETHLQFLFVGGGVKHARLPVVANEPLIAPHFQVRGYRPRGELRLSLAVADIHWLSLEPELEGLIVPSKFYGAIAAGRPIIFIGDTDGEIARLINAAECGKSFGKGRVQEVVDYLQLLSNDAGLRRRLGENGRRYCEDNLRRLSRIGEWDDLLSQVSVKKPDASLGERPTG